MWGQQQLRPVSPRSAGGGPPALPGAPTRGGINDWVKAKFNFVGENEAELNFQVGDVILVINKDDEGVRRKIDNNNSKRIIFNLYYHQTLMFPFFFFVHCISFFFLRLFFLYSGGKVN